MQVSGSMGLFDTVVMNGAAAVFTSAVLPAQVKRPTSYEILPTVAGGGTCDVRLEYREGPSTSTATWPDWAQFTDIVASTGAYTTAVRRIVSATSLPIRGPWIQYRLIANGGNTAHAHTVSVRENFDEAR